LSTSQPPTTLYGTTASPASCCLIDTWSAWLWRWLAIAALPSPLETVKGAGYDASRTTSHRDLFWGPFSSASTSLTCQPPFQKVCTCWWPGNHACWWNLAGSGRGAEQGHGNARWIPPTWKLKLSTTKSVSTAFHLNPLMTAIGGPFLAINCQPLELESCSNPLRIQQVF